MTFRTRLVVGFGAVVLVPLAVLGLGVRAEMASRVTSEFERRVQALVAVILADVEGQSAAIGERLAGLKQALAVDNRFRLAALQGAPSEEPYLLDYAGEAMRLTGLGLLQIQDEQGRILSSGHFRHEYDRLEPELPRLLAGAPGGLALVRARTAEAPFLALARLDSLRLGRRWFTLVGGVVVDTTYLARLARDSALQVSLITPHDTLSPVADSANRVVTDLAVPYVDGDAGRLVPARITVAHSLASLEALRRGVNTWFFAVVLVTTLVALLLAGWLSTRISRPLADLAARTARVDFDRLDVGFESDRPDEVGALTRLLGAMTERLRAGAARLREVERRAAMGDLARQVNHDVKNGLAPLRNVVRHLTQVAAERPAELGRVFGERQATVESSITYLESLAANYARLYPRAEARVCDVNEVIRDTLRHIASAGPGVRTALADGLPAVRADPLALRRVVENLVGNALDSLEGAGEAGSVTVATERADASGVRIVVADTGKGMSKQELERAFDDFYTTKPGGTGLGLSIVRRLVLDSSGALRVETEPGHGSRFIVELPAESPG